MDKVWRILVEYSLLLVLGAIVALFWANLAPQSYLAVVDVTLLEPSPVGHLHHGPNGESHRVLTLRFLVNDILMALFFALAGKEVWEAVALRTGELRGRKALTPLIATVGGMAGPALIYMLGAVALGKAAVLASGWAIPTATDIAFSYLVGRLVFGAGHPAIRFLLLLAIADDAGGLLILAVFYPTGDLAPFWLLLSLGAAASAYLLFNRLPRRLDRHKSERPNSTLVRRVFGFWPYLGAGALSWYAFQQAGIHPALGLLPIIPAIPHADVSFGIFAEAESGLPDLLNAIQQGLKAPVELILFAFALMNAGVAFSTMGAATWLVLAGLLIGKPAGILLMGWLAARPMGLGLPEGMRIADLFVMGCVAAIGFTVALFVAGVAFPAGPVQDAAKMGALLSFGAAIVALAMGRVFGVVRQAQA